ncbi:hypothetical protein OKW47_003484 [Paraburkholderia atlantica]
MSGVGLAKRTDFRARHVLEPLQLRKSILGISNSPSRSKTSSSCSRPRWHSASTGVESRAGDRLLARGCRVSLGYRPDAMAWPRQPARHKPSLDMPARQASMCWNIESAEVRFVAGVASSLASSMSVPYSACYTSPGHAHCRYSGIDGQISLSSGEATACRRAGYEPAACGFEAQFRIRFLQRGSGLSQ